MQELDKIKKIHFIGIGGIGISSVAKLMKWKGKEISGSDSIESEITKMLKDEGIKISLSQCKENVPQNADLVVYSVAVADDNIERIVAKEYGIAEITYPQLLSMLIANKYGIGISGTNGKTTVTAMLSKILIENNFDPTVVIGSKADFLSGNARLGESQYLIFESDEYRNAFKNYNPRIAVNTYIGADHFDFYKDEEAISQAFNEYFVKVPSDGYLIINADDPLSLKASKGCSAKIITYGIDNEADYKAEKITTTEGKQNFEVYKQSVGIKTSLIVPGKFNVYNSLAAIAAASTVGIEMNKIVASLENFKGVWRRFELLGEMNGKTVVSDYAHTPDAIEKTIRAAKEFFPEKRILVVFQPHQYSRTKKLFSQFSESFTQADKLIIPDIFYVEGRERPEDFDIDSNKLVKEIAERGVDSLYGGTLEQTNKEIKKCINDFDIILMMGAGDIYNLSKQLIQK